MKIRFPDYFKGMNSNFVKRRDDNTFDFVFMTNSNIKNFVTKEETPYMSSAVQTPPLVLILSKNGDTRVLLSTLVKLWEYRVREVDNISQLFNLNESELPVIILLDLSISFNEDLQVIKQLREFYTLPKLPILVLSGHAKAEHSAAALSIGADDYLVKPVDFEKLENTLKKYASSADGIDGIVENLGGLQ
jgi:CheY-like chemotaxis protein